MTTKIIKEMTKKQEENIKIKERFFNLFATLQIKINKALDKYLDGDIKALADIEKSRKELREWENVFNAYHNYIYDWTFETRTLLKIGLVD